MMNYDVAIKALQKFEELNILVIGDIIADVYVEGLPAQKRQVGVINQHSRITALIG